MLSHTTSSSPAVDLQTAWGLVTRFVLQGDVQANLALHQLLQNALNHADHHYQLSQAVPPVMLQQCLADDGAVPPSAVVFVCMLNRMFCLRVVPVSQAQPLDRRPGGLDGLLGLYLSALSAGCQLPVAAQRQLCLCAACIAVLRYDDVGTFLEEALQSTRAGSTPGNVFRLLISSLMDVLADSTVPIGSVRRAAQRRRLQELLHVSLVSVTSGGATPRDVQHIPLSEWLEQVEVVDRAISFLFEAMTGEPQIVAASFWAELPRSPLWAWMVQCLRGTGEWLAQLPPGESQELEDVDAVLPAAVLSCVSHILRCLTLVDDAAQQLLTDVLPLAMGLLRYAAACLPGCRLVASALEASTEEVVLRFPPDSAVFRLISSAAECLVGVLRQDSAVGFHPPDEAVLAACEGVSALAQVLRPAPVPTMEADDDPEDFAYFIQSVHEANAEKAAVVGVLAPFLAECQRVLLHRMRAETFVRAAAAGGTDDSSAWDVVAEYLQRNVIREPTDNDTSEGNNTFLCTEEDFQIAFDEVPLAIFTAYEWLTKVLTRLPDDAAGLASAEGHVAGVCSSSEASLMALSAVAANPQLLFSQAPLLPVMFRRFAQPILSSAARQNNTWAIAAWPPVLSVAVSVLEAAAQSHSLSTAGYAVEAAAFVVHAGVMVASKGSVAEGVSPGCNLTAIVGPLDRFLAAAWRCLLLPGPQPLHRRLTDAVADVLGAAGEAVSLPASFVNLVLKLDAYTQVSILCTCAIESSESFVYVLRCAQELTAPEEEMALKRAVLHLRRRMSPLFVAEPVRYASLLDDWHNVHPAFILFALQLSDAFPEEQRVRLRASCLLRFIGTGGSGHKSVQAAIGEVSSQQLHDVLCNRRLRHDVCLDVMHPLNDSSIGPQFLAAVLVLLQPHSAYQAAGGERRLQAAVHAARALALSQRLGGVEVCRILALAVQRAQEVVVAHRMSCDEASREDEGAEEDDGCSAMLNSTRDALAEIAKAVFVALDQGTISTTAPTLAHLVGAVDEHELRKRVTTLVGL